MAERSLQRKHEARWSKPNLPKTSGFKLPRQPYQHEGDAKARFLQRLAGEIKTRGALDVLRRGIKANGCKFQLAYFHPASSLNYALLNLYRYTGEGEWLDRAKDLATRAVFTASDPSSWPDSRYAESLYKGELGVALLAEELNRPEFAAMPFFELEG